MDLRRLERARLGLLELACQFEDLGHLLEQQLAGGLGVLHLLGELGEVECHLAREVGRVLNLGRHLGGGGVG